MTDETYRCKGNKGHWKLTLNERETLVEAHQMAEHFLQTEQTMDALRSAFRHYFSFVVHLGIVVDNYAAQWTIAQTDNMDEGLLRSALHRLNCQVLRYISGSHPCMHSCCCRCQAAYETIACNGVLANIPPPTPPDELS